MIFFFLEKEKLDCAEKIHPSWEASKKRKEQQSANFQGKRTKFEDDWAFHHYRCSCIGI